MGQQRGWRPGRRSLQSQRDAVYRQRRADVQRERAVGACDCVSVRLQGGRVHGGLQPANSWHTSAAKLLRRAGSVIGPTSCAVCKTINGATKLRRCADVRHCGAMQALSFSH